VIESEVRRKDMYKIVAFSILALIAIAGVAIGFSGIANSPEDGPETTDGPKTTIDMTVIFNQVTEIAEYATLSCPYADTVKYTKEKTVLIILTTRSEIIVKYTGKIKLGVNGREIKIDTRGTGIYVSLPPIRMLSHEQDPLVILDKDNGLLSRIEPEDMIKIQKMVKEEAETQLMKGDQYREAKEKLKSQLNNFLTNLPGIKDKYQVYID
jgi:hypothetical protein